MTSAHKAYLALAGLTFGLHALFLAVIPSHLEMLRADSVEVNLGVSVYAGIGLFSDLPAGRLAQRVGGRAVIMFGLVGAMISTFLLYLSSSVVLALFFLALIGISFSFILTPVIVGVAMTARNDGQIRSQGVNAGLQRLGALVATVFLLRLGGPSGLAFVYIGIGLFSVTMLLLSCMLPRSVTSAPVPSANMSDLRKVWSTSPMFRAGVFINLTTLLLLVYVGSLAIPIFSVVSESYAFGASLMARELICIVTAAILVMRPTFVLARRLWIVGALACAVGLSLLPCLISSNWYLAMGALGLGGVALGSGIVLANTLLHWGLDSTQKYVGFAVSSIFNKGLAILFPMALGLMGSYQVPGGAAITGCLIVLLVVIARMYIPRESLVLIQPSGRPV